MKEEVKPLPINHKYFVYLHIRNDSGVIFYVGKGKIYESNNHKELYRRAYQTTSRTKHWLGIYKLYGRTVIIDKTFVTETDALTYESELINKYKTITDGGNLVNYIIYDVVHEKNTTNHLIHPNSKAVYQYSLDGYFIKKFDSITDASKAVNATITTISIALGNIKNRKTYQAKGFLWRNDKYDKIDAHLITIRKPYIKKTYENKTSKTVYQYSLNHEFIKKWNSSTEIHKTLNINYSSIRNNLINLSQSAGGFHFTYDSPDKVLPIIIDTENKICIKCSIKKPKSEYYNATSNDGKAGACIECLKIYKKDYRELKKQEKQLTKMNYITYPIN